MQYPKSIHSAIPVHVDFTVALRIRISARSMRRQGSASNRNGQISVDIVYQKWFNPEYVTVRRFFFTSY